MRSEAYPRRRAIRAGRAVARRGRGDTGGDEERKVGYTKMVARPPVRASRHLRAHILPECVLKAHCQFATGKPQRSEMLRQPVQLTTTMRDHIRQKYGAHAVSARDQFVCRRCSYAISRRLFAWQKRSSCSRPPSDVQAQQSATAVSKMRELHGRSGPWLSLARVQSQLNKVKATNVQLQKSVSEARQKNMAEKHDATVATIALQAKISAEKRAFACSQAEQQTKHRRVLQRSMGANGKLREQNTTLKTKETQLRARLLEATNLQSGLVRPL